MLLIRSIKTEEVPGHLYELRSFDLKHFHFQRSSGAVTSENIVTEVVEGKWYVNAHEDRVCIGMSKQVQDAIGLPMEAFENMAHDIKQMIMVIDELAIKLENELQRIESANKMTFWDRIKFIIGRKMI